jgi:transposase-like protein
MPYSTPQADIDTALNLLRQGRSITDAARAVGMGRSTLRTKAREAGIAAKRGRPFQPDVHRVAAVSDLSRTYRALAAQLRGW